MGAGNVGSIIGGALLNSDKEFFVKYGVRDPDGSKYHKLLKEQPKASTAPVRSAIAWADVSILAIPGSFTDEEIHNVAKSLGPEIEGKVVIDATNPLTEYPHLEARVWSQGKSAGEVLAAALPKSAVYKTFNTIGAEHMAAADGSRITGQQLTMLMAGPEEQRAKAEAVVAGVGFEPCYVGPIRYARNLEAIAELWIHLGVPNAGFTKVSFGRNFNFQVMRKP